MNTKRIMRLWSLSLIVCALSSLVINLNTLFSFGLPLWVLLVCGGISLLALPVLIYTTIRRLLMEKKQPVPKEEDAP